MKPDILVEQHNKELEELYKKAEKDISDKVAEYNKSQQDKFYCATCPLFLKSHEGYENAEIKIMFFGQETNGWGDYEHGKTIEEIINSYEEFFISGYCYEHYRSPFWNGIKQIIKSLQERNANKKIGHLWNNIVKMGYNGKNFPHKFYDDIVKPHLNKIIVEEIKILKPDYIVFLTGPDYCQIINDVFGTPERKPVEGFKTNELCEVVISNEKMPSVKKSFSIYHPGYLQWKGKDVRENYFNKIIEEITQDIKN